MIDAVAAWGTAIGRAKELSRATLRRVPPPPPPPLTCGSSELQRRARGRGR